MRLIIALGAVLVTPAQDYKLAPTDRPDLGYAMIFPGMTIVKILFVDIVPVLFGY